MTLRYEACQRGEEKIGDRVGSVLDFLAFLRESGQANEEPPAKTVPYKSHIK